MNIFLLQIINKILQYNVGSKNELAYYSGKSFILNIVGISITATIMEDGLLAVCDDTEQTAIDTTIIIPITIMTYLIHQDKLEMFRQIKINGDLSFGVKLLEILSNLNFNGVYAHISPLNGVLLQQIERILIAIRNYFILISKNGGISISEYMQYETGNIINRHNIEKFCTNVDDVKIRTEILEKRLEKLVGSKI